MFQKFYPTEYVESSYEIDYEKLYKVGYRGIIFDIDNTLVEHGADASERAVSLIKRLKKIGFEVCLISNNKEDRVKRFNQVIKIKYIFNARKPSIKNYLKAMEYMNTDKSNTIFVGDQVFTDVYGANRAGITSYLVKPIGKKEEIQIVIKRQLERIVLIFYRRKKAKQKKRS
ncbi:YqeG family HAD IIIA-type phosphatase [Lachnoclostridium sp.]|uniref:YqeG family HAD IIIA-type phosphatase n=1 Tax=Lachnoclostridium sp. TaxID=2028282 RepID=UPI002898454B|nr:YqeG family HAD IIIA-type phosphatase [Lachnoclostridium sp.]